MFTFFNKRREKGTGAIEDVRTDAEKKRDYTFPELTASVNPVRWESKPEETWRKFPIYDQNGSGSCVAQTAAKLLGISYFLENDDYVHFSATDIYQQRFNKPAGGMAGFDVFRIIKKNGATLEDLVPSQSMTDKQMDSVKIPKYKRDVGRVFRVSNYITVPPKDIETVASIIQTTGKGVMVWFYFTREEWKTVPEVKVRGLNKSKALRHSVTATDFTLYKGKKALIIDDSWGYGYGKGGRRIITEDFFKERNYYAGYLMNFDFKEGEPVNKPHYNFTKTMKFGENNGDIKVMQDIFKYEGLFPQNVESTGYYGGITAKSVFEFQKKHRVASLSELESLKGMVAGPKTIAKLNEIYK